MEARVAVTNFNTRNDTYRKLMGNGLTYRVPRFQRDYSWGEDEWDDLWHDILGTIDPNGEPAHYMGYLVLQSSDEKQFDIIDGQQRLTTLSILVLAGLRQLQALIQNRQDVERTRQRLEGLRQTYIGFLDPVTLFPQSKLTLNRNNDNYYQTYLVPLVDKLPRRGFKASEHGLRKAFEWFDRRIAEFRGDGTDRGKEIAQLIDSMSDRLFFCGNCGYRPIECVQGIRNAECSRRTTVGNRPPEKLPFLTAASRRTARSRTP